ncbi:la protein 1-like [Carex rostrata]
MAAAIFEEANARSILRQVEFYFSDSNLPRDGFLRRAVEESEDGLVSLALICSFGRMRSILGLDNDTKPESVPADIVDAVSEVLKSRSTTLRISDDGKKVGRIAELLKPEELIEQLDSRTVAASPFPYDSTLEDVETFFSKQAKVSSVRLPKHVSDKRHFCGTALIEFSEEEDAKKILEANLVFAGAELALKSKKEYDTEREKQIEDHKKKNADKGPSYPKGVVISFQLEKKKKSDVTNSKKIEPENEKEKALDSIEKPTGEEAQENKSEEVGENSESAEEKQEAQENKSEEVGENSESAEEKPSEEGHDSKPKNAESISNDIGGTQITREDLKHVFGKFGNVKYIDFSMGQEAGYIRYEDSKGVETARAMAEVSEGGGLLVKDHIATVQVVAGEDEEKYWKELQEKRENKFDNSRGGGARNRGGRRESFGKHGRWNDSTDKRSRKAQRVN